MRSSLPTHIRTCGWPADMSNLFKQLIWVALVIGLYLLSALPLPYLLLDHYSAMAGGDAGHSATDIHVWLEWAAGSSLSGGKLFMISSDLVAGAAAVLRSDMPSNMFVTAIRTRGPPAS